MVSLKVGDSILVTKPGGKPRVEVVVQLYDSKNSLGEVHNKVVFKEGPDDHLDVADLQLDTIMLLTPVQAPPTTPAVSPPSSAPDSQTLFRSPEELLRAYPIVLMFRLGSKDRARFERRYLNMLDYERFFEALIPDHRHYLQFLRSTLDELEAKNLVRSGDHSISIGRFAVLPVG